MCRSSKVALRRSLRNRLNRRRRRQKRLKGKYMSSVSSRNRMLQMKHLMLAVGRGEIPSMLSTEFATPQQSYFNGGTYVVFSRQNGEQLVLGGQVQESSARSSFSFQTLNDSEVFYKQQWFANEAVERFLNDANAISRENLSRITMESSVV